MSAIGKVGDSYSQSVKELSQYYARLDAGMLPVQRGYRLNADDVLRREVINGLMCEGRVDFAQVEAAQGIRFNDYFAEALTQLDEHVADGLLQVQDDGLQLLPKGQLMVRSVAMRVLCVTITTWRSYASWNISGRSRKANRKAGSMGTNMSTKSTLLMP